MYQLYSTLNFAFCSDMCYYDYKYIQAYVVNQAQTNLL